MNIVSAGHRLHEYDLVPDRNAYPLGPMAEGRNIYRVIGYEGSDRGGLLLSKSEADSIKSAFNEIEFLRRELAKEQQYAKDIESSILACEKGQMIYDVLANYRSVRRTIQAIRNVA